MSSKSRSNRVGVVSRVAMLLALSAAPAQLAAGQTGIPLIIPPSEFMVQGMSGDGRFAIGSVHVAATTRRPAVYGPQGLEVLQFPALGDVAHAIASNDNGEIVVGLADTLSSAFVWNRATGAVQIIAPTPGSDVIIPKDISGDGSTIVGTLSHGGGSTTAFRWTSATGAESLAGPAGGESSAASVNQDGTVIVGEVLQAGVGFQACYWLNGVCVLLPGINASATAVSDDGSRVFGGLGNTAARLWTISSGAGTAQTLPIPDQEARIVGAASGDGRTAILRTTAITAGNWNGVWYQPLGATFVHSRLNQLGYDVAGWDSANMQCFGVSDDGTAMAGTGYVMVNGALQLRGWIANDKDSDGDSLFDSWEAYGIPYFNANGELQRYVLPGANPKKKDLYVEVDSMDGRAPASLAGVITAFANSPVPAVPGLDGGEGGINLHIEQDEGHQHILPVESWENSTHEGWPEFHALKSLYFGKPDEVGDIPLLEAKAKAYRYCLFVLRLPEEALGVGEVDAREALDNPMRTPEYGGNDLMVALRTGQFNTEQMKAAGFMHELGHTLGLGHGGIDHINGKPNYYSIMNYTWAFPIGASPVRLGYSTSAYGDLCEDQLDESAGVPGSSSLLTTSVPILVCKPGTVGEPGFCNNGTLHDPVQRCHHPHPVHPPFASGRCDKDEYELACVVHARFGKPIDWNNDGEINDGVLVCANPNADSGATSFPPGQSLRGFDDWDHLKYNFRDSPLNAAGSMPLTAPACMPESHGMMLASLPPLPCPGPMLQPGSPSPAAACVSASGVTYSAAPAGTPPFEYRWKRLDESQSPATWVELSNGTMAGGTVIDGARGRVLTIASASMSDLGGAPVQLRCQVTDFCDQSGETSPCTLVFEEISVQSTSPQEIVACPGSGASFTVQATGFGPFTYQWEVVEQPFQADLADGPMAGGTIVAGATTPTLTLSNLGANDWGTSFAWIRCKVTSSCGVSASGVFTLYVRGALLTTWPGPVDLTCAGATQATFSVTALGEPPLAFEWKRDGVVVADGGAYSGATTATLMIANPGGAEAGEYSCKVSNACGNDESGAVALNAGPPRILVQPSPLAGCLGWPAQTSVAAVGALPRTYQWMRNGIDLTDDARISGSQTSMLSIFELMAGDAGNYSVRVHSDCGDTVSASEALVFYQPTAIGTQPVDRIACPTGTAVMSIQPLVDDPNLWFGWQVEDSSDPSGWRWLEDGPLVVGVDTCGTVSGAYARDLSIVWGGSGTCATTQRLRCWQGGPCNHEISNPATLRVCAADFDCSGALTMQDVFAFLNGWFSGVPSADINGGGLSVSDVFEFLNRWFAGC